jgi:Calx-beta domain
MLFRKLFGLVECGPPRRRPAPCRLSVEALDDRIVPASLSVGYAVILEGNVGTQYALVSVNLDAPSKQIVTVNYATADGSASAGSDYGAVSGRLTFARGETSKTIAVPVYGDGLPEPDETFFVKLSPARHASIANATGVVTIWDDDAPRAVNDSKVTYSSTPVSGNVLANDTNTVAGGTLTVSTVNGSAANVGTPITLASGALLRVNSDGSYAYDPNGAFNWLAAGVGYATDSFTYTAANSLGVQSNTATVTFVIGNAPPGTHYEPACGCWLPSQPGDPGTDCTPDNPQYPNC